MVLVGYWVGLMIVLIMLVENWCEVYGVLFEDVVVVICDVFDFDLLVEYVYIFDIMKEMWGFFESVI